MQIQRNVPLSDFSSYKIGGPAGFFAEVSSSEGLEEVLRKWNKISANFSNDRKKILVLGGGTNILFSDRGFDGLVIHSKIKDIKILSDKDIKLKEKSPNIPISKYPNIYLKVGSGVLMEDLLNFCIQNGLSGLEWGGGLPGTLGGAVRGNAGAFGGEIKDSVKEVKSITCEVGEARTSQVKIRKNKNCRFGYRTSVFKTNSSDEFILEAILSLEKGDRKEIKKKINEKIEHRRTRHPIEYPNLGSIFKNVPVESLPDKAREEFKDKIKNDPFPILPSVKLIGGAGLTGARVGDIMVSPKHPNFLVNVSHGRSSDVLSLISKVKKAVRKKYGVDLEEEITIIDY